MTILPDAILTLKTVCGVQKEQSDASYRRTTLCVELPCDGGTLLLHTLTGVLLLLENAGEWETRRAELIQNWFLVPENFDEASFADKVLSVAALLYKKKPDAAPHAFTVLTTTDCNARCYYCYEAGVRKCTMTKETARDAAAYMMRVSGDLSLHWFGGEPLMNPEAIDVICSYLAENGVSFRSDMISNGYYFDEKTVEKARTLWNLQSIQITLDGTADVYDRVKAYVDAPHGGFDRVMRHVDRALDAGIAVQLRLNVCEQNIPDMTRLVDELTVRFRGKDVTVYSSLLGDFKGNNGRFSAKNLTADRYFAFKQHLTDAGFGMRAEPLSRERKLNACMADSDENEIILPDGRLCRCEQVLDKECYGSIYSPKRDTENLRSWKEQVKLPECFACPLYPRCVNLKKCAWVDSHCSELIQTIRRKALEEQMLASYRKWKGES